MIFKIRSAWKEKMEKHEIFAYSWFTNDPCNDKTNKDNTIIKIYGLTRDNENICVVIENFTPYVYIELPDNISWDETKASLLTSRIDNDLKDKKPVVKQLSYKKKLYYANVERKESNDKESNPKYSKRIYPFLQLAFTSTDHIKQLSYKLRNDISIQGIGKIRLKMHEQNASPVLQLTSLKKLPTAGWISFLGKRTTSDERLTRCKHEFKVQWKNLEAVNCNDVAKPLIMGYDIEVNSSDPGRMPKSNIEEDKIFQISCVFSRQSSHVHEKYLLTLGEPDFTTLDNDIDVLMCSTEYELLQGFVDLIQEKQPNIIIGYNIFTFDIPYMIDRSVLLMSIQDFEKQGMDIVGTAKKKVIEWSSSAYKNQSFEFLDAEGRIFVDLLPLVRRDYKMANYKLSTIAAYFLKGVTKDPLDAKGIFKCYKLGMLGGEKGKKAISLVGKYCVKDSLLVVKLFETLTTWVGLCEMSKVCNVPIFSLYTQGQQLKVFSQVYKRCTAENIVVERDGYITLENDYYTGATVFPPIPGVYDKVTPFDFCLAGNTRINTDNGYSVLLEDFSKYDKVIGWDGTSFKNYSSKGLICKGEKDTVKVWLQDGTCIVATPDHKFMTDDGTWCPASQLCGKYVKCGMEQPIDNRCSLEDNWELKVESRIFSMKNKKDRELSLAFSRIVGYALSDGTIYRSKARKCAELYMDTMIDVKDVMKDILKLCGKEVTIRKRKNKGITYSIALPALLAKDIHSLRDIVVGKRSTQPMKLPYFIMDNNCPLSIIREFIGGLFGGDGTAPSYMKSHAKGFRNLHMKWTTIVSFKQEMISVFEDMQKLFLKFGIDSVINILNVKYGEGIIKPMDFEKNPRVDISIRIYSGHTVLFSEIIGFRYCINKSATLTIASSYYRMQENIRKQYLDIMNILKEFGCTLDELTDFYFENQPVIHDYSIPKKDSSKGLKSRLRLDTLLSTKEYIEETGTVSWFTFNKKKSYAVLQDSEIIPSYRRKVIGVFENGKETVYDIFDVEGVHNFIADGMTAKNCSLYPTTIIAYNISWDTLVKDDDIPDSECHVMDWHDHIACPHDPKEIRKAELVKQIKY